MNHIRLLLLVPGAALAQQTPHEAFADGKAYKPQNAAVAGTITTDAAAAIPGRAPEREHDLMGQARGPLRAAGQDKIRHCASAPTSDDAYADQECATINYLQRNPAERPHTTIAADEPAVTTGATVHATPHAFVGDHPGLSGTYTACVDRTTRSPAVTNTERCLVGHAVTEGSCARQLTLTYRWAPYTNEAGAEVRYARCPTGTVRGDQLAIPTSTRYWNETVSCASRQHGTGAETLIWREDCSGSTVLHGYDARGCTAPPTPATSDPAHTVLTCTAMPRTAEHCFAPDGVYRGRSDVPVFEEHWDDSACATFDRQRGAIQ